MEALSLVDEYGKFQSLLDESLRRSNSFTRKIMPQTMTAREAISFINQERNAIIATVKRNGSPHVAWNPLAYVDDKLYTYADPNSVCFKNLIRNGKVSLAITSGNKAVFIEGESNKVGEVNKMIGTVLARIRSVVTNWIPDHSYNYASLAECQASIFEIRIGKILSYKGED
jgi:uncharacterized pyridoxamine 5'-phosphate oxidase family protein